MSRFGFLFAVISVLFLSHFTVADDSLNLTASTSALGVVRGGTAWSPVTSSSVWSPRAGGVVEWYSGPVTINQKKTNGNWLLLYGAGYWTCYGECLQEAATEVWASANKGRTWAQVDVTSGFSPMLSPATVQDSRGRQWRIQGSTRDDDCGNSGISDVYMSADGGSTWVEQPALPSDTGRILGTAVVDSSDNIYVFGGQTCTDSGSGSSPLGDMWRLPSSGSKVWKRINMNANTSPPPRSVHGSVVGKYYDSSSSSGIDALYVMGGFMMWDNRSPLFGNTYRNDVWVTTSLSGNTAIWSQLTDKASWTARGDSQLEITSKGIMIVAGGVSNAEGVQKRELNDVWASLDGGYTWGVCSDNARWEDRVFPYTVIDNDGKLYVMGGRAVPDDEPADLLNDIWVSQQSFDDIEGVSSMCGLVVPPCGVGLRCLPKDPNFVQAVWGVSCDACSWNPTTALQAPAASMTMTYLFVGFLLATIALALALGYLIYRMRQTGASSPIPLPASAQRWWNEKQGGAGLNDSLNKGNTSSEGDSMYNPLTIRDQM